jgi:hypothetical protein
MLEDESEPLFPHLVIRCGRASEKANYNNVEFFRDGPGRPALHRRYEPAQL